MRSRRCGACSTSRHLKTAEHLRSAFPDDGAEVAEVIGAHLFDAYKAAGDDPDAGELCAAACGAYTRAAERAESIGAPEAAEAAYLRAVDLSADEAERAALVEGAARMAGGAGWLERPSVTTRRRSLLTPRRGASSMLHG